ncbi:MAG: EamA family transporter [Alphaproteobacteria bacterium]|nr:EamA family transporter [Alphaproteobacteria bacterium]
MFIASDIFEGPGALATAWESLTLITTSSLAYTIYFSTLVATSLWAFLLSRHNPSQVVPFTLLIPIFGMGGAALFLQESYSYMTLGYAGFVLIGLGINQLSRRRIPKQPLRKIS